MSDAVCFRLQDAAWKTLWVLLAIVSLTAVPKEVFAVVGMAEELDQFEWEELRDFHRRVVMEEGEKVKEADLATQILELEDRKEQAGTEDEAQAYDLELEALKSQILPIPKVDRFKFELKGDFNYDKNSSRVPPRKGSKGDTIFNTDDTLRVDLSGKKTDLRFEVGLGKKWSVHFPTKDMWKVEERLRYRRRYFGKTAHSANTRLGRTATKTIEIDSDKIRWDAQLQHSLNYAFSRKLSLNVDMAHTRRMFLQEAFDQDSGWQVTFSPSGFWNFTPKSRISLGYSFGASRNREKSGNSNSHDVSWGYFGQITRKSSASLNMSYSLQLPQKKDSTTKTITVGMGYAWQATAKTQLSLQIIRSLQNTTSELTSGTVDGENTTTREDTYFTNDSVSLSLNTRLTKKINAGINLNMSHARNKTSRDQQDAQEAADTDVETRQFTFPVSVNINYIITRWMTMALGYDFSFRTGDEKQDTMRDHAWSGSLRMTF